MVVKCYMRVGTKSWDLVWTWFAFANLHLYPCFIWLKYQMFNTTTNAVTGLKNGLYRTPSLGRYITIQNGLYKAIHFWITYTSTFQIIQIWMITFLDDLQTGLFTFGEHKSSKFGKFGRYLTILTNCPHFEDLCGPQIINFSSLTLPVRGSNEEWKGECYMI